jgi:hypothetical protein
MLLWQLKLQKPLPWDQQIFLQKGLQQLLACTTGGNFMLTYHQCMQLQRSPGAAVVKQGPPRNGR